MAKSLSKNDWDSMFTDYKRNYSNREISSDLMLILLVLKDLALYLLLLIPNIVLLFFSFFSNDDNRSSMYFEKIFLEPFKIIMIIISWFFEAPVTAYLIVSLIFMFFVEIYYIANIEGLMYQLMTYQLHFFQGNYYSIFTSIFLHADIVHLLTNCLALLIFGRIVEKEFGLRTLFIFLFSGIFANIVSNTISYLQGDLYYSLGASGAIAGIIIFAVMLSPLSFTSFFIVPMPIFVIGWLLIALDITGFTGSSTTNHLAHLGGYGALLIMFFFLEFNNRKKIMSGFVLNLILLLVVYVLSKFITIDTLKELVFNLV